MSSYGQVWRCRRCGTILAIVTTDGRMWIEARAERLRVGALGWCWVVCPECHRVNARRLALDKLRMT